MKSNSYTQAEEYFNPVKDSKPLQSFGTKSHKEYFLTEKSELQSEMQSGSLRSSQPEILVTTKKCQVPILGSVGGRPIEGTTDKENLYYKIIMEPGVNIS